MGMNAGAQRNPQVTSFKEGMAKYKEVSKQAGWTDSEDEDEAAILKNPKGKTKDGDGDVRMRDYSTGWLDNDPLLSNSHIPSGSTGAQARQSTSAAGAGSTLGAQAAPTARPLSTPPVASTSFLTTDQIKGSYVGKTHRPSSSTGVPAASGSNTFKDHRTTVETEDESSDPGSDDEAGAEIDKLHGLPDNVVNGKEKKKKKSRFSVGKLFKSKKQ